ncbi:MAG: hypothetical protein J2P26_14820, partial [Nocardiopsaceae bacterium]|nr:hypothetical protein [Nocardiopsaceae bacterium]
MESNPGPGQEPTQPTRYDARPADVLFNSYGGRLYAYFQFMLADEAAAKRALEATLMAAAADERQLRGPGQRDPEQYAPWLFALARIECEKYPLADAVGAGRHWTAEVGGRPTLPEIARRAVARLKPNVREAFILSAPHNHLSLPQLTDVLGVRLVMAADLRAQAGLDFVRMVQSCALEADFTEFSGADLRIRAEESLARDASQPAPSLPILADPALAAFRDDPAPPSAASPGAAVPGAAVPGAALPGAVPSGAAPAGAVPPPAGPRAAAPTAVTRPGSPAAPPSSAGSAHPTAPTVPIPSRPVRPGAVPPGPVPPAAPSSPSASPASSRPASVPVSSASGARSSASVPPASAAPAQPGSGPRPSAPSSNAPSS